MQIEPRDLDAARASDIRAQVKEATRYLVPVTRESLIAALTAPVTVKPGSQIREYKHYRFSR